MTTLLCLKESTSLLSQPYPYTQTMSLTLKTNHNVLLGLRTLTLRTNHNVLFGLKLVKELTSLLSQPSPY